MPIAPAPPELVLVLPLVEFEIPNSSFSSLSSTLTANPDPSSYAKYFVNWSADVLGSEVAKIAGLATIYKKWQVTNNHVAVADLKAKVLNHFEDQALGGVLVFVTTGPGLSLHVLHGMRKYPGDPLRGTLMTWMDVTLILWNTRKTYWT